MRTFLQLRQMLMTTHKDLAHKLMTLEKKYDEEFKIVFEAIQELITPPKKLRRKISFVAKDIKKLTKLKLNHLPVR